MGTPSDNGNVATRSLIPLPAQCPACSGALYVSRLTCSACGTEIAGAFTAGRVVNAPEPHASLLEMFLRVRGNVKEMERELGLSYPTVRARLEEALAAAGLGRAPDRAGEQESASAQRHAVLDALERGEISAREAARRLRDIRSRRPR